MGDVRMSKTACLCALLICSMIVAFGGCTSSTMKQAQDLNMLAPGTLTVVTVSDNAPFVWINVSDTGRLGPYG